MKKPNNNLIPLIESFYSAGIAIGGYNSNRGAATDNVITGNTLVNNDTDNDGNGELMIQVSIKRLNYWLTVPGFSSFAFEAILEASLDLPIFCNSLK